MTPAPDEARDVSPVLDRLAADAALLAARRRRTPGSTYRFQFHREFTLPDATRLVPYLDALGITCVYASPILKAKPGSHHGYNVVDPGKLNPEVGTEEDFAAFSEALRDCGMGLILDAVPNHMCISGDNPWWADVLEHGPSSPHGAFFDIDWFDSPRPGLHGRLLLPVLGEPYGQELEGGQLRLVFENGAFAVAYHDTRLPIDPRTYGLILGPAVEDLKSRLGPEHPDVFELQSILTQVRHLPSRGEPDPARAAEGRVECAVLKRRLVESRGRFPAAAEAVRVVSRRLAGTPGDPASFAALDELLEAQAYRVCFWRVASDEINYRRFFDVNELAAVSTEREDVFRAVHRKLLGWLAAGQADGLRIDHPDGLYDPKGYLDRLQLHYLLATARAVLEAAPESYPGIDWNRDEPALAERLRAEPNPPARLPGKEGGEKPAASESPSPLGGGIGEGLTIARPLYVVVEKILGDNEALPADWACDGTTGYEFLNAVNGLFVDPAGEAPLSDFYEEFTGLADPYPQVVHDRKAQILSSSLYSELTTLSHQLDRLARLDRRSRDFTLHGITLALREVIAAFPVYRSYVNGGVQETDQKWINRAVKWARRRNPLLGKPLFDFIRNTLLLRDPPSGAASEEYRAAQRRFAVRFQQLTAPVTAKGIEDTAFYVYNRFVSLNEVGGEPGRWGGSPERLHRLFTDRAVKFPGGLSPLSTHDTKRSEDVRARLNVLSELPGEWAAHVRRWAGLNAGHKGGIEDEPDAPDANEEYLIYQTLVGFAQTEEEKRRGGEEEKSTGAGRSVGAADEEAVSSSPPLLFSSAEVDRVQGYVKKALCEAKVHSSWINPDAEYEVAVAGFVSKLLDPAASAEFLADLGAFVKRVAFFGRINSLAQTLVRCTAPGVPDTYQGTEAWDFSLVDPDNRRPVDYAARGAMLADLGARVVASSRAPCLLARELSADLSDPRAKLFVVSRALGCRREFADLFGRGGYLPVFATGEKAGHAFAFLRHLDGAAALTVVPRLPVGLVPDASRPPLGRRTWGDTTLELPEVVGPGRWENVFTREVLTDTNNRISAGESLGIFPVALLVFRGRGQ
jgi:(1->4)-alpha-D-glucan 1-alpha-D-glucosylmutase